MTRMQQGSTIAVAKTELYFTLATDFGKFMGRYGYILESWGAAMERLVRLPPLKTKGSLTVTPISTLIRFLYIDPTFSPNPLILILARTPT